MTPDQRALLLEAVSDRVLRNYSPTVWRQLFVGAENDAVRLEQRPGTLLCAQFDARSGGRPRVLAELRSLALECGGEVDPHADPVSIMRFDHATDALDMALAVQQLAGAERFQVGLATGACVVAHLRLGSQSLSLLVGSHVERALAVSELAPAGSIRIAADTVPLLEHRLEALSTCLVTTECTEEDVVCAVSLSLPPRATEALSTFAGLGFS